MNENFLRLELKGKVSLTDVSLTNKTPVKTKVMLYEDGNDNPVYSAYFEITFRSSSQIQKACKLLPFYILNISNMQLSNLKQFCALSKSTQKLKGEVNEYKYVI